MYWSKYFLPTLKEVPAGTEAISHQLSLRAGLVNMLTSGVYSYLPLGHRVLRRVENIIRQEMDAIGCHELLMPALQPIDIWKKTGRDVTMKEVMFSFDNKKAQRMCLGPTHEEIITDIAKQFVKSYRHLPVTLYQIQTKFRDEIRTRFGIVRACEFIMKDAYSFDRDWEGLKKNYDLQLQAYHKIFKRCGLDMIVVTADSGAMGGSVSHEFLVAAPIGEDAVWINKDSGQILKDEEGKTPQGSEWERKVAIELGHIFQLGTKYSESLGAVYLDENGSQKPIIMGCYGIGVSRLIAAVIEVNNDPAGIIWPKEIAPFDVEILPVQAGDGVSMGLAQKYYQELAQAGLDVLLDDRDESAGRKFNDADLIGIPLRIIIGKRMLAQNQVEIKLRRNGQVTVVDANKVSQEVLRLLSL
ncbi:MAG: proline--tRNA ligase [Candidatus Omnitrophica bacterium]|nr:proline--tRNA ligase [Candidatus Omnitrophota bacterium]MDE2009955.1 proline--tRNA ligase [Candidatus Omnitrophota bacterium]MDE2213933.1 proline--tRNA ligase [Candidatus Omnitrophota bacterium]MDE2231917.1 proline--tRNA ligase [Candidatus Omnitrophota bacterium]